MATTYQDTIRERLEKANISYPANLVVYGPERPDRTKYRREHGGCFGTCFVESLDEAVRFIEGLNYEGFVREMSVYWCNGDFHEI